MKQIIIINGCGGVGKDTFVNYCGEFIPTVNYSSVTEIKKIAKELGWKGGKSEKDRKFLSDLKLLSSAYSDFPFRCICKNIEDFLNSEYELMFIHIRDIEEIERVVETYPHIKTLLIKNNRIKPILSNSADANVNNYHYDIYINNNNGFIDLHDKAEILVNSLRSNKDKEIK